MKILYLVDYPLKMIGGANKSTLTTINMMQKKGNDVYLFTPGVDDNLVASINKSNIYVYNKPNNKYFEFVKKMYQLSKAISTFNPDIIHAQFSQIGFLLIIYINLFGKKEDIKYFFTDRSFFDEYNKKYRFIFKMFSKKLDGVICTTKTNFMRWEEEIPETQLYLLHNVLDKKWYEFNPINKTKIKSNYGVNNKTVIGFAGRYVEWKRWDLVFSICKKLAESEQYFVVIAISNSDPQKSCEENPELLDYINKLREILKKNIYVIFDANENKMIDFYYMLDFFVLTSRNESFGRVLIEAMTKSNIVIGTNSGGVPEVIGDDRFIYNFDEVDKVVDLISYYSHNNDEYKRSTDYFINRVREKFGIENYGDSLLSIYRSKK